MNTKMKFFLFVILFLASIPGLASYENLTGTYEMKESDIYEITVILPTSHSSIKVVEINYNLSSPFEAVSFTNMVNFEVNREELSTLKDSFTILADLDREYRINLMEKENRSTSELNILEYFISFFGGGVILLILYRLLTKKFTIN